MKEKRAKKIDERGIDRLSNLPESLLLHILSFLPTRTCVNTVSLVSRRYRNLWEHLQVLDVNEEHFHNLPISGNELFRYVSFFVNAFLLRRKSRAIHKFSLSCEFYRDEFSALYADTWIRTAIGPYLEELHLSLISDEVEAFNFPLNLLSSCPKLVSLSFYGEILPQTQLVFLPSLKKLEIDLVGEVDVAFLNVILSGCPILETLEVTVSTEYLTTLRVPNSLKSLTFIVENDVGACLEIEAPNLKYLRLINITFEGNAIGNLHKVDKAYLDVFSMPSESLCASIHPLNNLLRALSGVKYLVLGCSTKKWLWLFDVEFPEFQHLIHLDLILPCFNISFLYQVLQKCPMLQALKIKKLKDPLPPLYGCVPKPRSVPNCLVSHLRFIHLKRFQGNKDELKFIGYVLRKGLVLESVLISCFSKEQLEKDRIPRNFFNTPRGSGRCKLEFD